MSAKVEAQQELLSAIRAGQAAALKLVVGGTKVQGIFQKLRAAGDELEARVRYLTRGAAASAPDVTAKVKRPKTAKTEE